MFYDAGNGWSVSSFSGSWMIRPVLSWEKIVSDISNVNIKLKVYPNPVSSEIFIETSSFDNVISIYSIQGTLIRNVTTNSNKTKINIDDLSKGVYLLEIFDKKIENFKRLL